MQWFIYFVHVGNSAQVELHPSVVFAVHGFSQLGHSTKARLCFGRYLPPEAFLTSPLPFEIHGAVIIKGVELGLD